jgi:hypothetical protein
MPRFRVLRRIDAWIDHVAEVEATNPEEAASLALRLDGLQWRRAGETEFWNARFATLDEQGDELPETVVTRG